MRQAIRTRVIGPTDFKGMRIVAECLALKRFYPWDYSLDVDGNHTLAACRMMKELKWEMDTVSGSLKDGSAVHVFFVSHKSAWL